jgi:hypothetical protein
MMMDVAPAPQRHLWTRQPSELAMLCGDWTPGPVPWGWDAEEKKDGIRAMYIDGQLLTREGVPIECAAHVLPDLQRLERRFGQRMFFDGEFMEPGGFHETLAVFASRGKRASAGVFHLFDALPLDEWRADSCQMPLSARRDAIGWALGEWSPQWVRRIPSVAVGSRSAVEMLARATWAANLEGLVIKDSRSLYRRKRSPAWAKVKRKLSIIATVLEVLHDGAALKIEAHGKRLRVAVPLGFRASVIRLGPVAIGTSCKVEALEWSASGAALRQGRLVAPIRGG